MDSGKKSEQPSRKKRIIALLVNDHQYEEITRRAANAMMSRGACALKFLVDRGFCSR